MFPTTTKQGTEMAPLSKEGVGKVLGSVLRDMGKLGWYSSKSGNFGSQSLRRGGATFFARLGAESWFIQNQGRWKSDTYKIYCDRTWGDQLSALAQLSQVRYMVLDE